MTRAPLRSTLMLALAFAPIPALADPLVATKTAVVVSDPVGLALPKSLPGAVVDYRIRFTNPLTNTVASGIVVEDILPPQVSLRVADLAGAGKGPVEFLDGSALGTGLAGSGLSCSFAGLGSSSDCLDFSDGTSWSYQPTPDAGGYDDKVRAIRVKPGTFFVAGTAFQIRYRVKIR